MGGSDGSADETLTIRQVAVFIILIVVFVSILEKFVHYLHHLTRRKKKYRDMLVKTITELMVVGLIYLVVKLLSYLGALNGIQYAAIDAADILVFLVVIFLVLQSLVIFGVLSFANNLVDSVDLYTYEDLVAMTDDDKTRSVTWLFPPRAQRGMQIKLLEQVFCKVYGLPKLFSFPQYLMEIQEDQVIQLMELRISHWGILVGLFLLYFTCTGELQLHEGPYRVSKSSDAISTRQGTRVLVMGILSGTLHFFMVFLLLTLRGALVFLLRRATTYLTQDMSIPDLEQENETFDNQIDQMRYVSDQVRSLEPPKRYSIFGGELFLDIVAFLRCRPAHHPNALDVRVPEFKLTGFSLSRVQFFTQFYLILNGLYCAILCTSVIPSIDSTMNGFYVTLCVIPILINMFIVAPRLIAIFTVVLGVWQIDGNVLAKTIDNFVQVAKLKHQLRLDVRIYMEANNKSVDELIATKTEFVGIHECQKALKTCGVSLTRHELNTLLYLECKSSKGMIKWADIVDLCASNECDLHNESKKIYYRSATPH